MNIYQRLKKARKKLDLTQDMMAKPLGLSQANLRDLESGKVKISTLHVLAIEHIYKISANWLITGIGNMIQECGEGSQNGDIGRMDSVSAEHMDVINKFKNQERAKRLCEKLIMLESISENQLDKIEQEIDKRIEIAEDVVAEIKKTESIMDQNESDRRKKSIKWTSEERRKKAAS
jgi:DNA-binding XRE family transcriptional regulator